MTTDLQRNRGVALGSNGHEPDKLRGVATGSLVPKGSYVGMGEKLNMGGENRALTSLRGVAAISVVLFHYAITAQELSPFPVLTPVPHGYLAVDLFFILSGFIMTHTYQDTFRARSWGAFPSFMIKRVARIAPLNTCTVIVIVVPNVVGETIFGHPVLWGHSTWVSDTVLNILLLQGLGIGVLLNGPSWTISNEFFAYGMFPVIIKLLDCRPPRNGLIVSAACVSGIVLLAIMQPRLGLAYVSMPECLVRCITEFVLGVMTYRMSRFAACRQALGGDRAGVFLILATSGIALLRVDLLTVLLFPPLIAALALNNGKVARFSGGRVPYFLGEISFSIYMWHDPLRSVWFGVIKAWFGTAVPWAFAELSVLVTTALVIPVAYLSYVAIERPGRRVLRRVSDFADRPRLATG